MDSAGGAVFIGSHAVRCGCVGEDEYSLISGVAPMGSWKQCPGQSTDASSMH
jgi:hypothetical protein